MTERRSRSRDALDRREQGIEDAVVNLRAVFANVQVEALQERHCVVALAQASFAFEGLGPVAQTTDQRQAERLPMCIVSYLELVVLERLQRLAREAVRRAGCSNRAGSDESR